MEESTTSGLLGASDIRKLAAQLGVHPTKKFGQNFVIDPGTVRKIVREAHVDQTSQVMEVGPGLGSLTLAILETGATLTSIEIDTPLALALPHTIAEYMPEAKLRFSVIEKDALTVSRETFLAKRAEYASNASGMGQVIDVDKPFTLVANLPYNVATPIILTLLERFPMLTSFVVMVQDEVADRLTATPGNKIYGTPSVKLAWYGASRKVGKIGRNVFWPAPNVDSALVYFERNTDVSRETKRNEELRELTFTCIDKAFMQRRKTIRAALKGVCTTEQLAMAEIDPQVRGESLVVDDFYRLASVINGGE